MMTLKKLSQAQIGVMNQLLESDGLTDRHHAFVHFRTTTVRRLILAGMITRPEFDRYLLTDAGKDMIRQYRVERRLQATNPKGATHGQDKDEGRNRD